MAKNLVIVESPAKVATIKKFLGRNYEVVASNGHVRDLPKSDMGVDLEHDFEPRYITIRGKGELLSNLRKEVKKASRVFLATDPDREGEAISWHLIAALKLEDKEVYRISFNEITKNAILKAIDHPREIDEDLVNAQQARRVIDRVVGYSISPLLWAKVKRGLSAGRVQSSTLRLVCDREDEIKNFVPEEYWTLDGTFDVEGEKKELSAKFYGTKDGKMDVGNEAEALKIKEKVQSSQAKILDVKTGKREKKAPLPFTTSTLQQEASKTLNFTTQKTMRVAQQLYEGVAIKGKGTIALITYLRTDSTRISDTALDMAREYITSEIGSSYFGGAPASKKSGGKVQDAHEAIRPTDITLTPSMVKDAIPKDLYRLYQLIWKRFCASCMKPAVFDTTTVEVDCGGYVFKASASSMRFDGYMSVYRTEEDEKENVNVLLGKLDRVTKLAVKDVVCDQHFTQPPAHFTEASLVRTLEELGIGRPSTYAPTITNLLLKHYVAKEGKNIFTTELGEVVNDIMKESFPDVVDEQFTARMEEQLDAVENGEMEWKDILREFYPNLDRELKKAQEELEKVEIRDEETDVICDKCGRNMVIKYGPHGKFLACPGFPECRNTKIYLEKAGVSCPKCGKEVLIRKTKKGRRYYGCEDNPACDFMSWAKPTGEKCPKCGSYMVEKGKHKVCQGEGCGYSE